MFHDKDPLEPVIQHILDNLENKEKYSPDIIILLQNTSPLRDSTYIDGGYKISIFKNFYDFNNDMWVYQTWAKFTNVLKELRTKNQI